MTKRAANAKACRLARAARARRLHARLRATRLVVFLSGKHAYAQIISPDARVLVSASTAEKEMREEYGKNGGNVAAAAAIGRRLAEKALPAELGKISFDRGGRRYDGRVKALAEAARAGGLLF